ncbi:MAG: peptidoglycan-binding protein, partial [Ruthenibacterium sp.]
MPITITAVSPPYPGTALTVGSSGSTVARMQKYLNALRKKYPTLPLLTVDGKFGSGTKQAVTTYQALTGLKADGVIGQNTWNSIVTNYNTTIGGSAETYPGIPLRSGMTGEDVTLMQTYCNALVTPYTAINRQSVDGKFGSNMLAAAERFQEQFSLTADGVIGQLTWNKIVAVHTARQRVTTPYPGYVISQGASGDSVRFIQSYVNAGIGASLTSDGQFG